MWLDVLRWVSIALCWVAIVMDIVAFVRTERTHRKLHKELLKWRELNKELERKIYNEITENSENNNEVKDYENN